MEESKTSPVLLRWSWSQLTGSILLSTKAKQWLNTSLNSLTAEEALQRYVLPKERQHLFHSIRKAFQTKKWFYKNFQLSIEKKQYLGILFGRIISHNNRVQKAYGVIGFYETNAYNAIDHEYFMEHTKHLDQFPGPCFIADSNFNLLHVNQFLQKITGHKPGELLKMKCNAFCSSNSFSCPLNSNPIRQRTDLHCFIITKDQVMIPILKNTYTKCNGDYRLHLEYISGTRAESETETNYLISKEIIEKHKSPVWFFSLKGQILFANQSAMEKSGYSQCQLANRSVHDLHPQYRERPNRWQSLIQELHSHPVEVKTTLHTSNKQVLPVEINYKLINIQKQKIISCFMRDLTQEKTTKAALQASKNRFQKLANNATEIFWLQTRFQLIYINPSFEQTFGIPASKLYSDPTEITIHIHPEDRNRLLKEYGRLKETSYIKIEFRIVKPDGTISWISGRTFPTEERHNGHQVLLGIASDVTELKHKEQELIEERKKAEESDRIKTSFLATMSHELRTPLNSILGFSEIICMRSTDPEILEYGEIIYKSGQNLLNIIENILTFSQLNGKSFRYQPSCFYLSEVMKLLSLDRYSEKVNFNKEAINYQYAPDTRESIPLCHADSKIILNIFDILIENALLYTPEGVVQYGYRLLNQKEIQFFVKDTGIGISKENQKVILDYFRQVDSSSSRKYGGIGLGLSIAHELVKLHRGNLSFQSELGKGSQFYFTLPCRIEESELEQLSEKKEQKKYPDE